MNNTLKIIGIVDGAVLSALTALGQLVPSWALYCHVGVIVLGAVGTTVSAIGALQSGSSS
jgi:uncharacterized membrane protein